MTFLLLDGYNLLYRSFVTLPAAITAGDGLPIHALYGLLTAIARLQRGYGPARVIAAFDVPAVPTFRHELYPPYQGQRGPLGGDNADDFQRQVDIARGALPRLGIPAPAVPRYEADDILGTFAVQIAESGDTAFIVSTDRDLLQLVRDRIAVIVPGRDDARVDSEDIVRDRLGVPPAGVTTWKALCGDPSDNIPGVQGVGTKTAAALTNRYGTLEAIFEHLEELPRRQATLLDAQREDAFLFRRIVTIKTDLDTAVDIADVTEPSVTAESKPRPLLEQVGLGDARS